MIDDMDRAQALEAFDREHALADLRARIAASLSPRDASVDGRCIECEQPIEPGRLQAMRHATSRCASCAAEHERRLRGAP